MMLVLVLPQILKNHRFDVWDPKRPNSMRCMRLMIQVMNMPSEPKNERIRHFVVFVWSPLNPATFMTFPISSRLRFPARTIGPPPWGCDMKSCCPGCLSFLDPLNFTYELIPTYNLRCPQYGQCFMITNKGLCSLMIPEIHSVMKTMIWGFFLLGLHTSAKPRGQSTRAERSFSLIGNGEPDCYQYNNSFEFRSRVHDPKNHWNKYEHPIVYTIYPPRHNSLLFPFGRHLELRDIHWRKISPPTPPDRNPAGGGRKKTAVLKLSHFSWAKRNGMQDASQDATTKRDIRHTQCKCKQIQVVSVKVLWK